MRRLSIRQVQPGSYLLVRMDERGNEVSQVGPMDADGLRQQAAEYMSRGFADVALVLASVADGAQVNVGGTKQQALDRLATGRQRGWRARRRQLE